MDDEQARKILDDLKVLLERATSELDAGNHEGFTAAVGELVHMGQLLVEE